MLERFRSLMTVTTRPDRLMVRGEGSFLWDDQGRRYLDFIQGWAVNALGHAAPEMACALARQASLLITASPALYNAPQIELAERLVKLTGLHRVGFCNSGAEANEGAIKLARKWGRLHRHGANEIVTTEHAFHGRTLAAMAASGKPGWDDLFPPNMPGFRRVPFGDLEAIRRDVAARDAKTAAIMVEPIQGEAGVIVPPPGYLRGLRELANEFGVLLVFDEVQTGLGRTGRLFAFEHEGVRPDILTLGKGLGGGVPLSAVLANERADCFAPGDQGGTYHGNPLMTAVGNAVVECIARPDFLATVRARAAVLERGLRALASRHRGSVRGRGLLWAIELPVPYADSVRDACFETGLIINAARPHILRFMPSLRVEENEIASMLDVLDTALAKVLVASSPRQEEMTRERRLSPAPVLVAEAPLVQKAIVRALGTRGIAASPVSTVDMGLALLSKATESFPMLLVGGMPAQDLQTLIRAFHAYNPRGEVVLCADDETELDVGDGEITVLLKPFTLPKLLQVVESRLAEVAPAGEDDVGVDRSSGRARAEGRSRRKRGSRRRDHGGAPS